MLDKSRLHAQCVDNPALPPREHLQGKNLELTEDPQQINSLCEGGPDIAWPQRGEHTQNAGKQFFEHAAPPEFLRSWIQIKKPPAPATSITCIDSIRISSNQSFFEGPHYCTRIDAIAIKNFIFFRVFLIFARSRAGKVRSLDCTKNGASPGWSAI
jgi:hypothetical protein